MVKTIETLVEDIYSLLEGKNNNELPEELSKEFGKKMEEMGNSRLSNQEYNSSLRLSNIGKPCERQIWLSIHKSDLAEPLPAKARLKFLYGDCIEELLLFLAEVSGHKVECQQKEVNLEGIKGHIDAIIDGVLVDVKSASTYSFKKFNGGELINNDPFGYIGQIQSYLEGCQDWDELTDKNRCAFLVMDKTLGDICLDIHKKVPFDVRKIAKHKIEVMNSNEVPERAFSPVPDGKSGNMMLPMECSYCNMKHACYENLYTYIYSNGPRYLTRVVKEPNVPRAEK